MKGTHVKNVKDPVEVQPPGSDRVFIALCMEEARNGVALALFDYTPLYLCHGSVTSCISDPKFAPLV